MPRYYTMALAAVLRLVGSMALAAPASFTDTEHWMGAEYTPAAAPGNGYWWQWFDSYEAGAMLTHADPC